MYSKLVWRSFMFQLQFYGHMLLMILMVKKLLEYEKELQKANQEKFRIEKVVKKKGDKLHVKWKGYDNLLSRWIDKKDAI